MADMIDRQAAIDALSRGSGCGKSCHRAIKNLPSVDAVEVVRCKDCKWFNDFGCAIRIVDDSDKPKENDYCSFGERKDD